MTVIHSTAFNYVDGVLCVDGVRLAEIAREVGTPTFVYSGQAIDRAYEQIDQALAQVPHMVAYAMKANSNAAVLRRLARAGAGADIVSGGELQRALAAGFPAERIAFSGVGKTDEEIVAALDAKIFSLHVESPEELWVIEGLARERNVVAPVSLRLNPDVDAKTHPYISTGMHSSKFGIEFDVARSLLPRLLSSASLQLVGLTCHVGSLVLDAAPIAEAAQRVSEFAVECAAAGAELKCIDAGGGWPILYGDEGREAESPAAFGQAIIEGIRRGGGLDLGLRVMIEPGRAIVGDAGVLLTRVLYVKEQAGRRFIIVDGAMTELIRPALYSAYHAVMPEREPGAGQDMRPADVVGPVCESADFLAKGRALPADLRRGDLLALRGAGAYAAVMGSNYNSRPLAAEVMVEDSGFKLARRRQTLAQLCELEAELSGA